MEVYVVYDSDDLPAEDLRQDFMSIVQRVMLLRFHLPVLKLLLRGLLQAQLLMS